MKTVFDAILANSLAVSALQSLVSIAAAAGTDLTISAGSGGASLVLKQGTNGGATLTLPGTSGENEFLNIFPTNSTTQTSNKYGVRAYYTISNANTTHGYRNAAILGEIATASNNTQDYSGILAGIYAYAHHSGSGTAANLLGKYVVVGVYGAGNASDAFGTYTNITQAAGSTGRITNAYGYYLALSTIAGSGARPTNLYGFYCTDQSGLADNVYAFYAEGNTPSRFDGAVTVGSLSTGGAISTSAITPATALGTGTISTAGGMSVTKNIWLGLQLRFEAGSDNTIGINFGGDAYLYRWGGGNVRLDGANFHVNGDTLPVTNATYDLGSSTKKWRQLFVSGAATCGTLTVTGSKVNVASLPTSAAGLDVGDIYNDGGTLKVKT